VFDVIIDRRDLCNEFYYKYSQIYKGIYLKKILKMDLDNHNTKFNSQRGWIVS
jgi:peptide methionine sulfoxide reductase MsrB